MIRIDAGESFILSVSLAEYSDDYEGKSAYFDIRDANDSVLNPINNGILVESIVIAGIYKSSISISSPGIYTCYIVFPSIINLTETIVVNQKTVAESVWSDSTALSLLEDILFIKEIESGKWKITNNQMVFYKSDNSTELLRFNLFNKEGNPSEEDVFERVKTSASSLELLNTLETLNTLEML